MRCAVSQFEMLCCFEPEFDRDCRAPKKPKNGQQQKKTISKLKKFQKIGCLNRCAPDANVHCTIYAFRFQQLKQSTGIAFENHTPNIHVCDERSPLYSNADTI